MPEPIFRHSHRVTYGDCTLGNHVYYGRYLDFLEAARGEFFRHVGKTLSRLEGEDFIFPVIEARLNYHRPARYDEVLEIDVFVTELDGVRLGFGYRVLCADKLILTGATRHVCTSRAEKPKRPDPGLVERLRSHLRGETRENTGK